MEQMRFREVIERELEEEANRQRLEEEKGDENE